MKGRRKKGRERKEVELGVLTRLTKGWGGEEWICAFRRNVDVLIGLTRKPPRSSCFGNELRLAAQKRTLSACWAAQDLRAMRNPLYLSDELFISLLRYRV